MKSVEEYNPAFPVPDNAMFVGMTLRDWFAGKFLAGAAVGNDPLDRNAGESLEAARARYWAGIASVAYIAADAMTEARKENL